MLADNIACAYEITKLMWANVGDKYKFSEAAVVKALGRLERLHYVERVPPTNYWGLPIEEDSTSKRTKYYQLSEQGRHIFKQEIEWLADVVSEGRYRLGQGEKPEFPDIDIARLIP
jgi:DNA-binding PadR family transcriptional regulator